MLENKQFKSNQSMIRQKNREYNKQEKNGARLYCGWGRNREQELKDRIAVAEMPVTVVVVVVEEEEVGQQPCLVRPW